MGWSSSRATRILYVGPRFDGRVDETVEAPDRIVTPGFISTHAHISGSPLDRSFIEDRGNPQFWYSGLFEMLPVRSEAQDEEGGRACVDFSMAELLRGGVTTVMEIGTLGEYVVERAPHYGLRVYMGQAFRSGRWLTRDGKRVEWEWNEEQGRAGLERAIAFHKRHDGAHGDLVRCFVSPSQIDTCTPELLRDAKRFADEVGRPYQVHTSQSVVEFNEMVARHGKTPIAWMKELGVLGSNTILGHAIIIGGSSWTNYPAGDVQLMADAGATVAHAVWVFARRGVAMESFGRYRAAGVNMSLGTDTNPQSVIEAMRWAAVVSKMMERNTEATTAAHAFDAATLGGARALLRDDLGRVAAGRQGRPRPVEGALVADDAAARSRQEHRLQRERRGRGPRLRQRPPRGGGRPRPRRRRGQDPRRAPGRGRAHVAAHDQVRLGRSRG